MCECVYPATRTPTRTHVHVFVSAHACMRVLRSRSWAGGLAGGKAVRACTIVQREGDRHDAPSNGSDECNIGFPVAIKVA